MPEAILVVQTNVTDPSRTDEFNKWYTEVHLPEAIRKVGGFVAGTRYEMAEAEVVRGAERPTHRYMAIIEIEAESLDEVARELNRAIRDKQMTMSETVDLANASAHFYTVISPRVTK